MRNVTIVCDNNGCGQTVSPSGRWTITETEDGYTVRYLEDDTDNHGYDVCSEDCLVRMESRIRTRILQTRRRGQ